MSLARRIEAALHRAELARDADDFDAQWAAIAEAERELADEDARRRARVVEEIEATAKGRAA